MPTISDVAPDRASYRPGETAHITVTLTNRQSTTVRVHLVLSLTHLDQLIEQIGQNSEIGAGATVPVVFTLTPPPTPLHGYGLDATLYDEAGLVLAAGSGALDVLEHWSQAPRYGFLSDFAPGQSDVMARCDSLCRSHLNVVQFYDWMWRHYALLPPADAIEPGTQQSYTDALGRRLALATVRETIAAVQARGAAALAYGAVYGAEPEYADAHPELALFDDAGRRVSLAELFYIMNIAPGSPWVPLIVAEFAQAIRALDFDGIHLDQYGFPKLAHTAAGDLVDLSTHFPPLIDAARAAVVAAKPSAGVIFNAVGNWPIETVAPTTQDVVYIEVWPPDESYNDLRRLIADARRLSANKPVILAAYLSPFLDCAPEQLAQAEAAAFLSTAVIAASGGSQLLLGERDGMLCDPYYPKYATLRPAFVPQLHAYYDLLVRYEEWLVAPELSDWSAASIQLSGPAGSTQAEAGRVWVIARQKPGYRIIHLINLIDQDTTDWNALRTPPTLLSNLGVSIADMPPTQQILLVTPEAASARPLQLLAKHDNTALKLCVPNVQTWAMLICVLKR
ncbi:MAG: glycoside hydrolase family 66 protein [Roseiflexaceae bacterium]